MIAVLLLILLVWAVVAVIGFIIKGLLWLAFIGLILFVVTSLFGWFRRSRS